MPVENEYSCFTRRGRGQAARVGWFAAVSWRPTRPAGRGQDEALTLTSIAVGSPATPLRVLPPGVQRACQRLEEGEAMAPSCLGSREGHPSDL